MVFIRHLYHAKLSHPLCITYNWKKGFPHSHIYSGAIKRIQYLFLTIWSCVKFSVKMLSLVIAAKRLALQNTNTNCFAVINKGVMSLILKSVFPIKTRFVPDKWHSALHDCLVQKTVGKTAPLFNHKIPPDGFKHNLNFYPSQIISLWTKFRRDYCINNCAARY